MDEGIVRNLLEKDPYSGVYQKEYIRKDGTAFPIEVRVWLIRDDKGEPSGIWGFVSRYFPICLLQCRYPTTKPAFLAQLTGVFC